MMKLEKIISNVSNGVALVMVILSVLYLSGCPRSCEKRPEIIERDTTSVAKIDTIRHTAPKPISSIVTGVSTIPMNRLVFVERERPDIDTSLFHGGQLQITRETKVYADSTYKVQISGIDANLDFIEVYPRNVTTYITEKQIVRETARKWSVNAGTGVSFLQDVTPYAFANVSYQHKRWSFTGQIEKPLVDRKISYTFEVGFKIL